ncbi:DUF6062 family protein [Caldicellulosiruptor morganii]|uniref:DUF6062 family protein n=1 Tax=Caldicellulosiruptor morganii TaxID=1387555 RepID=A0ABY7BS29_9FIRM|nr:DUF6062 family protein [Caldicellulosiruptor morganii]WAM34710.1 DUF6062 family protein [Caldicellulosiruptor morganii]
MGDEKIYMIPVNDAFSVDCECAFCYLENNFEKQCLEIVLGESVMEVDSRVETNKKGFCPRHFHMLLEQKNKLPYGLMLETHIYEIKTNFERILSSHFMSLNTQKREGFLSRFLNNKALRENLLNDLLAFFKTINSQCVICERINARMKNYFDVFFFMWKTKKDFQQKVLNSKGFCLYHFYDLLKISQNHLHSTDLDQFVEKICKIELDAISQIYKNICEFNKQFDYRNANNIPAHEVRNSLINATEKLGKYK